MTGYTPLFSSIIASSIWRESKETKIVWITMLAMSDCRGKVDASVIGLADMAKVTLEECQTALKVLSSPDEWSRTKEHDGRRIEEVDGGWIILNHAKFREKSRKRAEYMREYRTKRNQNVTNVTTCNHMLPPVTESNSNSNSNTNIKNTKSSSEACQPAEPIVAFIDVPLVVSQGNYTISQKQVDTWSTLFPRVDVPQTLRELVAWNMANPTRRKTRTGIEKHIVGWLTKEQNSGRQYNEESERPRKINMFEADKRRLGLK